MATRILYIARHGMADAFGELTGAGREQASLLGQRLARVPVAAVWHSPLLRAAHSAQQIARHLPNVPLAAAEELTDCVPYVPGAADIPASWAGFFDGYDETEAASGQQLAAALVARFARTADRADGTGSAAGGETHEVLVTHAYPAAWLVRHAMDAAPARWLSLASSANTALTVIEYRDGLPPTIVMFNDMSHLPDQLRWTGFPLRARP